MSSSRTVDVVIIGGGAAGLSAAVALGRSLRTVTVIDSGNPRNAPAHSAHNVLGREGISPLDLLEEGRREAEGYGVEVLHDDAVSVSRLDEGFEVGLAGGNRIQGRRLLLATGLRDELPEIPGVRELWGKSVLHCPYCHGWEVRGQRIGILGTSPMSVHQALLFRQLSDDVTLFTHRMPDPGGEAWDQLAAMDIEVTEGEVSELRTESGELRSVVLEDGREFRVDATVVATRLHARAELWQQLGGRLEPHPMGEFIPAGPMGSTDIPGVWVAGNAADLPAMVGASSAAGLQAGAAINADLIMEDANAAVRQRAASASGR